MSTVYQQSRTGESNGGVITVTVIATFAVVLRLVARKISSASFWWDDWTIIIALMFNFGLSSCYWVQARDYGAGRHTIHAGGPVDEAQVVGFLKAFLALQVLYYCTSMAFKTSLILLYYRLFGVVRGFRYTLVIAEFVVASYFIACTLVAIFECRPIPYHWNKNIPGKCINQLRYYQWSGVANLLVDFMILSLTFPMVWRLKIPLRQKITLSSIFLLGTFVFVASIVRVTQFPQIDRKDITYTNVSAGIWTVTEQSLGITCACLPTLRPLFGRVLFGGANNSGSATLNNDGSRATQLSKLSGKPKMNKSSRDEGARSFARLRDETIPSSSITSCGTTSPKNNERVAPKAILRTDLIEQHSEIVEMV